MRKGRLQLSAKHENVRVFYGTYRSGRVQQGACYGGAVHAAVPVNNAGRPYHGRQAGCGERGALCSAGVYLAAVCADGGSWYVMKPGFDSIIGFAPGDPETGLAACGPPGKGTYTVYVSPHGLFVTQHNVCAFFYGIATICSKNPLHPRRQVL